MNKSKTILKRSSGRNITQTTSVMGKKTFEYSEHWTGGGSSCPSITLGALAWGLGNQYFILGQVSSVDALITNGTTPFTPSVTVGSLPAGISLSTISAFGNNYIRLSGTPTTFGSYTFTIGGTDANGCAITPRSYTIEVGAVFVNNTPQAMVPYSQIPVTVTGIGDTLGTNVRLESVTFNTTQDLSDLYWYTNVPSVATMYFFDTGMGAISGTDLVNTVLKAGSPLLTTGSGTYTGEFSPQNAFGDFSELDGGDPNVVWEIVPETTGTFTSVSLLFLPI